MLLTCLHVHTTLLFLGFLLATAQINAAHEAQLSKIQREIQKLEKDVEKNPFREMDLGDVSRRCRKLDYTDREPRQPPTPDESSKNYLTQCEAFDRYLQQYTEFTKRKTETQKELAYCKDILQLNQLKLLESALTIFDQYPDIVRNVVFFKEANGKILTRDSSSPREKLFVRYKCSTKELVFTDKEYLGIF